MSAVGTGRLSNLPSVIQLVYGSTELQTADFLTIKPVCPQPLTFLCFLYPRMVQQILQPKEGFITSIFKTKKWKYTSPWLQSQFEKEKQNPALKPLVSSLSTSASCSLAPGP